MKVEVNVYVSMNPNDEFFSEVPLEIEFDMFPNGSYEIVEYKIDGKLVSFPDLLTDNKNLNKQVANVIEHFIINYEPNYMNCE